jgi:glycosyltransferase involved in cell wall biosynthesis
MECNRALKEWIRPYYLRWLYFRLKPAGKPPAFGDCWKLPFVRLPLKEASGPAWLREFLAGVPEGLPDIVVYPMTDWHTRLQRSQQLALAFASLGHRVIILNPHLGRQFETVPLVDRSHRLSRLGERIVELHVRLPREPVFHHRLLSAREDRVLCEAVDALVAAMRTGSAVQIVSFPVWMEAAVRLRERRGYPILYDCHDWLPGFGNIAPELLAAETAAMELADAVAFSSQVLLDRHVPERPAIGEKSLVVRNAVDGDLLPAPRGHTRPAERVAGYVGALESWFDTRCVEAAARRHPECRFVLAGRIENDQVKALGGLRNVELLGEVPYRDLPALLCRFRVALIPFLRNNLTLAANPVKLYEYFRFGLPVVSTRLPEVEAFGGLVYTASTPEEFAVQLEAALEEEDASREEARRRIAREQNWQSRCRLVLQASQAKPVKR